MKLAMIRFSDSEYHLAENEANITLCGEATPAGADRAVTRRTAGTTCRSCATTDTKAQAEILDFSEAMEPAKQGYGSMHNQARERNRAESEKKRAVALLADLFDLGSGGDKQGA